MKYLKPVIVCGDLNVAHDVIDVYNGVEIENYKKAGFLKSERSSLDRFLKFEGFKDTFRELNPSEKKYSYWNHKAAREERNEGWRLDYFLVSNQMMGAVVESSIEDEFNGSDHCPIKLKLNIDHIMKFDE
jgi:exodeoxyribonuclease-3